MSEYLEKLKPLPGRVFVGMRPKLFDIEGLIFIPEKYKYPQSRVGVCTGVTVYPENKAVWVWDKGKRVKRVMSGHNREMIDMVGKWVACSNGRMVQGNLFEVRFEDVWAIVPELSDVSVDEVPRCQRCKSTGEGNILLGGDGFCPVCGYNEQGLHISKKVITVTDDEARAYAYDRERRLAMLKNRPREGKTIYSFGKRPFYAGIKSKRGR